MFFDAEYQLEVKVEENDALFRVSGGDARKLFNALELIVSTFPKEEKVIKGG